jgi:hypothetical protein
MYELSERGSVFIPQTLCVLEVFKGVVEKELRSDFAIDNPHHSSVVSTGRSAHYLISYICFYILVSLCSLCITHVYIFDMQASNAASNTALIPNIQSTSSLLL